MTAPFTDALVDGRLRWFLPCHRQSLFSVSQLRRNFDNGRPSAAVQGTSNGTVNRAQIRVIRGPHVWLNEMHVLTLQVNAVRTVFLAMWERAQITQESLADAKVSARQQCVYEGP